jgi:hypothetical protein
MSAPIMQLYAPKLRAVPYDLSDKDRQTFVVVNYADHLASHAYDEEKERALFESAYAESEGITGKAYLFWFERDGETYSSSAVKYAWLGWQLCAKSRSKAAGCE